MVIISEPGYVPATNLLSPAFMQQITAPIDWAAIGQQYNFTPVSAEQSAQQVLQNYAQWSLTQGSQTAPVMEAGLVKSAGASPFAYLAGALVGGALAQTGAQYLTGTAGTPQQEGAQLATVVGGAAGLTTVSQVIQWVQTNYPGVAATVITWIKANWKWLAIAVGAATAIALIVNWIKGGSKPTKKALGVRGKARRYSIGSNPRMGTLIKVGKRVDKITNRFVQRARHAGLIKIPSRTRYTVYRHHRRYAH